MVLKSLGTAISNIDDAPIELNGIILKNCFDTPQGIGSKLISHYTQESVNEVLKILGSIDILGNPIGLLTNIGTGVQDLFEKPIDGFA
jgi:vacuolar protein sorting-associated protein 13A/C